MDIDCLFAAMDCSDACFFCSRPLPNHFVPYAGSCLSELPAPLVAWRRIYTTIETHDAWMTEYTIAEPEVFSLVMCGEGNIGAVWAGPDLSDIELCPEVCAQFDLHAGLEIEFGLPPCD